VGLLGYVRRLWRRDDGGLRDPGGLRLTREEALRARLMRNQAVSEETKDSGEVVISMPIIETPAFKVLAWLMKRATKQPVPSHKKIELDEIGSFIWRGCDGKATVEDLVRGVSREYKIPRKEAEHSVTLFVKQLAEKRLVAIDLSEVMEARKASAREGAGGDGGRGREKSP
jgi:hypothetical protein